MELTSCQLIMKKYTYDILMSSVIKSFSFILFSTCKLGINTVTAKDDSAVVTALLSAHRNQYDVSKI